MAESFHEVMDFAESMKRLGVDITAYNANDKMYLLKVAKLCAKQAGIPVGAAIGIATAGAGSVTLPVVGAVPGYVAGFLAGFVGGMAACIIARVGMKRDLDKILQETTDVTKARVLHM